MALIGMVTSTSIENDAWCGSIIQTRDMVVASATSHHGRLHLAETPSMRREVFTFVHEGHVEDVAVLRRRISPRRAFQITTNHDADSLFAYLLTSIDAAEDSDVALMRSVNDIASSGVRGNFNFLLATERALYAHRGGRQALAFAVRNDALIVCTERFGSSRWRVLPPGSLIRLDRGTSLSWQMLVGALDASEPELPFTD